MKTLFVRFSLYTLALATVAMSLRAADPQLLNMAMPGAHTFAGINVEQAKTSQFGQFLLANVPVSMDIHEFVTKTSFDPRRDLREVLVITSAAPDAASGEPVKRSSMHALLLVKGTFNIPQIIAAAATDPKVKVSTYAGAQLLVVGDSGDEKALGLVDASTAAAGTVDEVKGALDRRNGTNVIAPAVMAQINQLSTTEDAWSITTADFGALMPAGAGGGSGSAVLQGIQQASGGVKLGSQIQVTGQAVTRDAKDASALGDVIKLVAQMIQMHSGDNAGAQVRDLLKGLVVTTEGNTVNVSLSLPEDQLEALFKLAAEHHGQHAPEKI